MPLETLNEPKIQSLIIDRPARKSEFDAIAELEPETWLELKKILDTMREHYIERFVSRAWAVGYVWPSKAEQLQLGRETYQRAQIRVAEIEKNAIVQSNAGNIGRAAYEYIQRAGGFKLTFPRETASFAFSR